MTLLGSEHSLLIRSKFRSVLQLRLQQRRTREQLADHGIMPPLKSPAVFHEQRKSLERSKVSPKSEIHGEDDLPSNQTNQAESPMTSNPLTSPTPVPAIVKSKTCDKNRHKKPKDTKPKVKKLKYHQYIPPDQKAERSPPTMDSAYARLLQQQQLFLQLQILSQQKRHHQPQQHQQHFNYQPLHQPQLNSDLKIKQPPSYEDAVKQVVKFIKCLIKNNPHSSTKKPLIWSEMPAHAKEERSCISKVPRITVSSGSTSVPVRKTQGPYKQISSFEHGTSNRDNHLEALLNSPVSRANEIALLKIETEDPQHEGIAEGFSGSRQEELLNTHDIETPLSPIDARISPSTTEGQGLNLAFNESPWETMEWLDLTPPSSATGFAPLPVTGPSIFNTEFLDVTDLNLNPAMDLHLEQW
ncbi:UNVERIFIED_CONTAM: hypothetical protein FKN15_056931 [Acipenser sinensis]